MHYESDFNEIYQEFQPKINHYLSRILGDQASEDVTQEVFTKISRGLNRFKGESSLSTWIFRIATNTAIDKMRSPLFKRSFERTTPTDSMESEDRNIWTGHIVSSVDQKVVRKEMSECVREFVDRLPTDYKTVLILSEFEGFKNREIADILEISLDNVKARLHRARVRLKKELDNACSFYHNEQGTLACDRKPVGRMPNPAMEGTEPKG